MRIASSETALPAVMPVPEGSAAGQAQASSFPAASPEARRLAAAILEVLAGVQAPTDAAKVLGISLARYYQLELRAVAGLVTACENRRRGRGRASGSDLGSLRRECEQLRRECARQQALARATRRTVGLVPEPPPPVAPGEVKPKRRKRRPTARAMKMAALLQAKDATERPQVAPVATDAEVRCPASPTPL